ncbi:uncharacterized protein LOC126827576 [Patella vulgata]|uniref:uncharacterized protein LOC126827576 n=1 Tax=Patella vulgata TaxID=6465 RepID=UPI0021800DCD|nr:uncharacterized protein LOC126827576 [Patella vulgata]
MMIKWFIVTVISTTSLCVGTYVYFDEKVSFDAAVVKCKDLGMELAMASTKQTYHALLAFINTLSIDEEGLWFGLEYNPTLDRYQWLNGDLLVRGNWKRLQAQDKDCVTIKNENNYQWATRRCEIPRPVICEDLGQEPRFIFFDNPVLNYTEAKQLCSDNGYQFPLVPTEGDELALVDFIKNVTPDRDIFLGVEKMAAGNFQWINGLDVEYYAWKNISNCPLNINIQHDGFYCGENVSRPYICETNTSTSSQKPFFEHLAAAVDIPAVPLQECSGIIKTRCAMLCYYNIQCYYFAFKLPHCKLYGDVDYILVGNGLYSVWF